MNTCCLNVFIYDKKQMHIKFHSFVWSRNVMKCKRQKLAFSIILKPVLINFIIMSDNIK